MVFARSADMASVTSQDTTAMLYDTVRQRFVCADILDDDTLPRACHVVAYVSSRVGRERVLAATEYLVTRGTTSAVVVAAVIDRERLPCSHVCRSSLWGRSLAACAH